MKQLILDFFSPPKVEKPKKVKGQIEENRVFVAPNGCKITMNGTMLLYEDGEEPYKQIFSDIKEAYESFKYWCKLEKKNTTKVAY